VTASLKLVKPAGLTYDFGSFEEGSMQRSTRLLITMASVLWMTSANAYYTTMDSGTVLPPGNYKLGVETHFITEGDDGVNLAARFDGPITDELNWKTLLGFGTTDFFAGGFVKWVPVPDLESQPAIGITAGVLYANYEGVSELSLRAHPFVSKEFELEFGDVAPYLALPIGIRTVDNETDVPFQAALGVEFRPDGLEKINFVAELGFDVNDAFPYFALGANLTFDDENGIEFK
jgi:hypothetical protein